jgi:hypothetical protein
MQQIQAKSQKPKEPEAKSPKPEAKKKKAKKTCQKNTSPQYFVQIHICKSKKSRSSISRQSAQYLFPSLAPKKLKIPQFSAIFIGKTINRN